MPYIVYRHISPSGKCYIGITCQTMERRARGGKGYAECTAFYNAIKKHGWDNFLHEILEDGLSFEQACEREQHYIAKYNSLTSGNGYNLVNGGLVNCRVSEETKRKISMTLTGRKGSPRTEETRRKISEALRGRKAPPRSKEYCEKLSASLRGRTFTHEHRKRISESKTGTQAGKNNPRARKVLCVETGVIFDTIKEAGEFKGGSSKNIIACCQGRLKTSGGYHWQYIDEVVR